MMKTMCSKSKSFIAYILISNLKDDTQMIKSWQWQKLEHKHYLVVDICAFYKGIYHYSTEWSWQTDVWMILQMAWIRLTYCSANLAIFHWYEGSVIDLLPLLSKIQILMILSQLSLMMTCVSMHQHCVWWYICHIRFPGRISPLSYSHP